jgi:hypothetical protein
VLAVKRAVPGVHLPGDTFELEVKKEKEFLRR